MIMNIWIGKVAVFIGLVVMVIIRAPHGKRRGKIKAVKSARGKLEIVVLMLAWLTCVILPVLWLVSPLFSFADYRLHLVPFVAGVVAYSYGLWLFYRAHADLATNWSISLDIVENHTLITNGVYRSIRHPMYAAILLHAIGQALIASNWLVGPAYLCDFVLMLALRLGREEQMMREQFGVDYETYMKSTKRIIPGVC